VDDLEKDVKKLAMEPARSITARAAMFGTITAADVQRITEYT